MKKQILWTIIGMLLLSSASAFSFKFNVLGYDVSYNPVKEEQVINKVDNLPTAKPTNKDIPMSQGNGFEVITTTANVPVQLHEFDNDIKLLNGIPEVRQALGDLGYNRIAFINTDDNERYVFLVDNQGMITSVYKDKEMYAEVETKGSLLKIRDYAKRGDFERLKLAVEIPFMVKMKLLLTQWF